MPNNSRITLNVTRRADGRVCKKVDGRVRIWPDEATARRDLLALIALKENPAALVAKPRNETATVRDVFNAYLEDRQQLAAGGKITPGSMYTAKRACETFVAAPGGLAPFRTGRGFTAWAVHPVCSATTGSLQTRSGRVDGQAWSMGINKTGRDDPIGL